MALSGIGQRSPKVYKTF